MGVPDVGGSRSWGFSGLGGQGGWGLKDSGKRDGGYRQNPLCVMVESYTVPMW